MSNEVFLVDCFYFLQNLIPLKQGILGPELTVTCFDINANLILFGSNSGSIYGFSRGAKASRTPHFSEKFISACITSLKLIDDNLIVVTAGQQIFVRDRKKSQTLYQWNSPSFTFITALDLIYPEGNISDLMLFTGDKLGQVYMHCVHEGSQRLIFQEQKASNDQRSHQVVQISCCDPSVVLVSTCDRSCIIKIDSTHERNEVIQVGKNTRKTCGKYGAIYFNDVIYASRPSLHLIRASETDGSVIETFILKKAKEPEPLGMIELKQNSEKPPPTQLGYLIPVKYSNSNQCLVSWNKHNFFLIDPSGQVLIKEADLNPVIDVKSCADDVFILFKDRKFLRIRYNYDNNFEVSKPNNTAPEDDNSSVDYSLNALFTPVIPIAYEAFSQMKKFLPVIENLTGLESRRESLSQLSATEQSNYTSSSTDDEAATTPLVVRKKVRSKRKSNKRPQISIQCESDSLSTTSSKKNLSLEDTSVSSSSSLTVKTPLQKDQSFANMHPQVATDADKISPALINNATDTTKFKTNDDCLESTCKNEDTENQLYQVLTRYKESRSYEQNLLDVEGSSKTRSSTSSSEMESTGSDDCGLQTTERPALVVETVANAITNKLPSENIDSAEMLAKPRMPVDIDWTLVLEARSANNNIRVKCLCASSYEDQMGIGRVWLCCQTGKSVSLHYLPSFKSIRLASKSAVLNIGASTRCIIVLHADGKIYRKEGDGIKITTAKWSRINLERAQCKILHISLNSSNNIAWCCDEKGQAWLLKLKNDVLCPVRNEPETVPNLKCVTVAPQDSTVVWGLDFVGNVFVRHGIFNDEQDNDKLIGGVSWLKVDAPVFAWSITATSSSVWILDIEGSRIFRRLSMQPPQDYVGTDWEEIKCPTFVNDRVKQLSASLNNDIWLLTDSGSVWQYCNHPLRSTQELESDWLLIC